MYRYACFLISLVVAYSEMSLFIDTQRNIPLTGQLYQAVREDTACYIDDTMTERVTVYVAGESWYYLGYNHTCISSQMQHGLSLLQQKLQQ